jgi:hypothetical protein
MQKILVFVCAFVVSSIVIYSVYYYSKVGKLTSGVVATANELPKTIFSPIQPKHFSDSNYMGNAGLLAALDSTAHNSDFDAVPAANNLSENGIYNDAFIDKINLDISNKFPNHPPIGFRNLKEGDKILFNYFFKNIMLPADFYNYDQGLSYNQKHFRAIVYMPDSASNTKVFARNNNVELLYAPIENGTEAIIFSKNSLGSEIPATYMQKLDSISTKQAVIIPEIDFNIIKYWKPEEAYFIPNAKDYKQLEDRKKLKLSVSNNNSPLPKTAASLQPPFYMYLYKNGAAKPYFMLYIANEELLLP